MTVVRVFDPAMCCSTGICGPSVDRQLVRFAADLDWLKSQGVSVERFNLSQQPGAFAEDTAVKQALQSQGEASLPLVKVDGEVKSSGTYPTRAELASWAGLAAHSADAAAASPPSAAKEPASRCCGSAKASACCPPAANAADKSNAGACCAPASEGATAAPNKPGCC